MELRPATMDDAEMLFRWANDPTTRRNSFNTERIAWADHVTWLTNRLADSETELFVIDHDGEPVATARFDLADVATISITVAPEHRGKGLAAPVIRAACEKVDRSVLAEILPTNIASIRAFERAGFEQTDGRQGVLSYKRKNR